MLKIFQTQLVGYFKTIEEKNEFQYEEAARLLASSILGDGNVFFHGLEEMNAVAENAIIGPEPFPKAQRLMKNGELASLTPLDQVIIVSRFSSDKEAIQLAERILETGATVIGISAVMNEGDSLEKIANFHINSALNAPIIPTDDGNKVGFPSVITAMYAYYGLFFVIKEILEEYE